MVLKFIMNFIEKIKSLLEKKIYGEEITDE